MLLTLWATGAEVESLMDRQTGSSIEIKKTAKQQQNVKLVRVNFLLPLLFEAVLQFVWIVRFVSQLLSLEIRCRSWSRQNMKRDYI